MRKLRVTCPANILSFMQIGDIIIDYEVITDNVATPLIKVNTSNYAKDNKFKENDRFMWWASESFWIGFSNVEVIEEGERKMKYELRDSSKSWWVEGMIVEGEIKGRNGILEINSIDICRLNKDIMSKEQIIECMETFRYGWRKDYLKEIKPTFTMLEKLLLEHQLEMGYKYITRDVIHHRLIFFKNKPENSGCNWFGENEINYHVFDTYLTELYTFVSCENKEPTLIQDILDRYEVIENEKI